MAPAIPKMPVPNSARLLGSGTGEFLTMPMVATSVRASPFGAPITAYPDPLESFTLITSPSARAKDTPLASKNLVGKKNGEATPGKINLLSLLLKLFSPTSDEMFEDPAQSRIVPVAPVTS